MQSLITLLLSIDWLAIIGALTAVTTALIALFTLIPGDQPEKALRSFATFISKFSRK